MDSRWREELEARASTWPQESNLQQDCLACLPRRTAFLARVSCWHFHWVGFEYITRSTVTSESRGLYKRKITPTQGSPSLTVDCNSSSSWWWPCFSLRQAPPSLPGPNCQQDWDGSLFPPPDTSRCWNEWCLVEKRTCKIWDEVFKKKFWVQQK